MINEIVHDKLYDDIYVYNKRSFGSRWTLNFSPNISFFLACVVFLDCNIIKTKRTTSACKNPYNESIFIEFTYRETFITVDKEEKNDNITGNDINFYGAFQSQMSIGNPPKARLPRHQPWSMIYKFSELLPLPIRTIHLISKVKSAVKNKPRKIIIWYT